MQSKFADEDTEKTKTLKSNTLGNSSQFAYLLKKRKTSSSTVHALANQGISNKEVQGILYDLYNCCGKGKIIEGTANCCCFLNSFCKDGSYNCDWDSAIAVFKYCHDITKDKDGEELDNFYQSKFRNCVHGTDEKSNRLIMQYTIDEYIGGKRFTMDVCRNTYLKAYNITDCAFKKCSKLYKKHLSDENVVGFSKRRFTDATIHDFTYAQTREMIEANLGCTSNCNFNNKNTLIAILL
jgi:hypothetical protein